MDTIYNKIALRIKLLGQMNNIFQKNYFYNYYHLKDKINPAKIISLAFSHFIVFIGINFEAILKDMIVKKDIRKLGLEEIKAFAIGCKEPSYRGKQVYEWLWKKSAN